MGKMNVHVEIVPLAPQSATTYRKLPKNVRDVFIASFFGESSGTQERGEDELEEEGGGRGERCALGREP